MSYDTTREQNAERFPITEAARMDAERLGFTITHSGTPGYPFLLTSTRPHTDAGVFASLTEVRAWLRGWAARHYRAVGEAETP